ncbi:hypothetical protein Niako_4708 [Niastella koreensis GR20-10]|uniref:Uncharacterized protein n=1 Tax=Niastella koreensis (strain DSM 17620 / KACC 11465 / NBRC 106392 / GR20-10) TaxID=700598 RepID=G8TNN8_NIAKG|nr:hypothetical protein Niako_4708 [Niastella koreensis GR20-10]
MLLPAYLLTFCNKYAEESTNTLKLTTSDYLCTSSKLVV